LNAATAYSKSLEASLKAQREEAHTQRLIAEQHEAIARDLTLLVTQLQSRLEEQQAELTRTRAARTADIQALEEERARSLKALEEAATLRRRLELVREPATTSGSRASDEQLAEYKKILRCNVCKERQKNTVIARCFHIFCKECIDENLAA